MWSYRRRFKGARLGGGVMNNKFVRESPILPLSEIYPQLKSQIESRKKILDQIEIERNREYVDKMTKEQKTSVNIELDHELLKKIDQEAAQDLRTRKAQVLYIIREYFNKPEEK